MPTGFFPRPEDQCKMGDGIIVEFSHLEKLYQRNKELILLVRLLSAYPANQMPDAMIGALVERTELFNAIAAAQLLGKVAGAEFTLIHFEKVLEMVTRLLKEEKK